MSEEQSTVYSLDEKLARHYLDTGIDMYVTGDQHRKELAMRVSENRLALSQQAIDLLTSFMKDTGQFYLANIEVFPARNDEGGDFSFFYTFAADRDHYEYSYTYFKVIFGHHEPPSKPFHPFQFIVGFY